MQRLSLAVAAATLTCASVVHGQTPEHSLMPVPANLTFGAGTLAIDSSFRVALAGPSDSVLMRASVRLLRRLAGQTGIPLPARVSRDTSGATLVIRIGRPGHRLPALADDESYQLTVASEGASLRAATRAGALHGIETFLQLVQTGGRGFEAPAVTIEDHPRFPWRGLLIDACRHWMPPDVVRRVLDGMAAAKLNVLHWHLSEDQGFRVESKHFPKLHRLGSDGNYYTQAEIRDLIRYAADRGIRVVPEFDMPGHTSSWFVGHPELASAPGPYEIERRWGVFDPTMDPTREETYRFLDRFIGEMAALFPDAYFHVGGDEVSGVQWRDGAHVRQFMREHRLADHRALQAYFNRRLASILTRYGKRMVGWDEILHPALPKSIVIQSWRGTKALTETVREGGQGILSAGYYLDHQQPASVHYAVDPLGPDATTLDSVARRRVLGGEACMWAEYVVAENVESRIWPRAAAVAERLWSPAEVQNTDDMYRRLEAMSGRLERLGLTHRSALTLMRRRLLPAPDATTALDDLAAALEPAKGLRVAARYTSATPLNRLIDAIPPESDRARILGRKVAVFLSDSQRSLEAAAIDAELRRWMDQAAVLQPHFATSFLLQEYQPVSQRVAEVARAGQHALALLRGGKVFGATEWDEARALLTLAAEKQDEVLIVIVPAVSQLVNAARPTP